MSENYYKLRKEKLKKLGYYIYIYTDPRKEGEFKYDDIILDHEPFYVGKGFGGRWKVHLYEHSLKKNNHKSSKIKQILKENLNPVVIKIYENLTEKDALIKEKEIIKKIGLNNLTNVLDGGRVSYKYLKKHLNKGKKHSEETKNKISQKLKNRVISKEWRKKISESSKGKKKKFSEEHKKNISISKKGSTPWNKGIKGGTPWNKGKKMSEEHKKKLSESKIGKKRNPLSDETKKKISESLKIYNKKKDDK